MKNLPIIFATLLLLSLYSCNRTGKPAHVSADMIVKMESPVPLAKAEEVAGNTSGETTSPEPDNKKLDTLRIDKLKIIKDGTLSVKAKDLTSAKNSLDSILQNLHAYYGNEAYSKSERSLTYSLTIRIPSGNFEQFLRDVERGGNEITEKNIHARDVTEEYVDIEARLKNKRIYLEKYNELLSRATKMKDIIELQESIRSIMEEIESSEAHLRLMNDQVSYSTLNINLYQPLDYVFQAAKEDSFGQRVKHSLNNGWVAVVNFFVAILNIWPVIIMAISGLFIYRGIRRKKGKPAIVKA